MSSDKNPMANIEAIQTKIDDLESEAEAILDNAASGDRDLSEQEQSRFDAIMGPPENVGNEGLIYDLHGDKARWMAVQQRKDQLAEIRAQDQNRRRELAVAEVSVSGLQAEAFPLGANRPIYVPATAKAHRPLAKSGFENEVEAYAAGRWYLAAIGHQPSIAWCKDHGIPIKAQQQIGDSAKGGYLVPTPLERTIIDIREQFGVARQDCRIYGMGADTLKIPKNLTSLAAAPTAELAAITPSDKTWEEIKLDVEKWAILVQFSSELNEDSIVDIAMNLSMDMGRAFAAAEDDSLFNGDGTGSFNGITGIKNALNAGAIFTPANGKTTFGALEIGDYEKLIGLLPNIGGMNPVWYMHKSAWAASVLPLLTAAGGNLIQTLEAGATMAAGYDFFFLGYPGRFLNVGTTTADEGASVAGAVYFGDLNLGTAFGDRRGVSIALSDQFGFNTDSWYIRGTERFDIQVHEQGDATNSGTICMLNFPPS